MPVLQAIQTSFAAGELSRRMRGRLDSEANKRGLAECKNWRVLPHGSLLKRAGAKLVADLGALAYSPRLIPFRVAGGAEDYCIVLKDGELRIYAADETPVVISVNLATNGAFNADLSGWTIAGGSAAVWHEGAVRFSYDSINPFTEFYQPLTLDNGISYTFSCRMRRVGAGPTVVNRHVNGVNYAWQADLTESWQTYTFGINGTGASVNYGVRVETNGAEVVDLDDVVIYRNAGGTVNSLVAPWTAAQLEEVRYSSEPTRNRMVFTHPDVAPWVLTLTGTAVWELYEAGFASRPDEWFGTNWPALVEAGFQGRLWFGATEDQPSTVWFSKSGDTFNFTKGVNDGDAGSFIVSTKGKLRWLRGKQVLLSGDDVVEHSLRGSSRVITPSDVDVRDESAFGSGNVDALHIGDQVLFVTRDLKRIRAVDYSTEKNGFISQSLSFYAEHLFGTKIRRMHFAYAPDPTIIIELKNSTLVAATYDRGADVLAWWTLDATDAIGSAAVMEGDDGAEVWVVSTRGANKLIERIPLHEASVNYVDSWVAGVVDGAGEFAGLGHLEGREVRVIVDGTRLPNETVNGGKVAPGLDYAGLAIVVGLPYTARAKTLPPAESVIGKSRVVKAGLLLENSFPPLVNGDRVDADLAAGATSVSGRTSTVTLGREDEGAFTIEQDEPFRTEVLATYGIISQNEVSV